MNLLIKGKMFKVLVNVYNWYSNALGLIRGKYVGFLIKKVGSNLIVSQRCYIMGPKGIEIGNYVSVNRDVTLDGVGGLKIDRKSTRLNSSHT